GVSVGPRVRAMAFLGTVSGRSVSLDLRAADVADAGEIVLTGSRPGSGIVRGRITDEQDLPVANRAIRVGIGRASQNLVTDADGCYTLTDMPTDRSITITIEVPSYGTWSRTTTADDYACDFQLVPQGWGALGQEAPPLVADTWFNHAPITLKEARGRVVLLTFRNFTMDRDPGLATIRSLLTEFGPNGLLVIAIYDHLPGGNPVAADLVTTHLTSLFEGASIAGVLDSDPDLVADLMPPGRPPGVTAGATHWLYQVHERPVSFLIDKKGIVRFCEPRENNLRERIVELLDE
ncbi:MAG TPA: carboxypeptidase regulatory-like domain-containing protein, partial [Sedimentisphaerales bacterium]|nr:carboxypeptidase regulatory-like domain-containing protein [Sedimentisphaerales bacterium]